MTRRKLTLKQWGLVMVFAVISALSVGVIYAGVMLLLFLSNNIYIILIGAIIFMLFVVLSNRIFNWLERYLRWIGTKTKIIQKIEKEFKK